MFRKLALRRKVLLFIMIIIQIIFETIRVSACHYQSTSRINKQCSVEVYSFRVGSRFVPTGLSFACLENQNPKIVDIIMCCVYIILIFLPRRLTKENQTSISSASASASASKSASSSLPATSVIVDFMNFK